MFDPRICIALALPFLASALTLRDIPSKRCNEVNKALLLVRDGFVYSQISSEQIKEAFADGFIPFDVTDDDAVRKFACQVAEAKSIIGIVKVLITERIWDKFVLGPYKRMGGADGMRENTDIGDMVMKWMNDSHLLDPQDGDDYTYTFNLPLENDLDEIKSAFYYAVDTYGEDFWGRAVAAIRGNEYRIETEGSAYYNSIIINRENVPNIARALRHSSNVEELAEEFGMPEEQQWRLESDLWTLSYATRRWYREKYGRNNLIEALDIFESLELFELPL